MRAGRTLPVAVLPGLLAAVLVSAAAVLTPHDAFAGDERIETGAAPPLIARDLDDRRFDLGESVREGPAVVTFWATWCRPCRRELPELQKLVERFGQRGFRVVAVSGDGPVDRAKVRPYVKASGFDFTVISDPDGEIRRRFGVEVFPTTFLIDTAGRIVHRQVGYRRGDERLLAARIRELLPEEPAPPDSTHRGPGGNR